jgi:excisionase family DNA binding protein
MVDKLLTSPEASKLLRCSIHTIRAWQSQKRIPVVRLGSKVLFREKDLQDLVDKGILDRK